MIDRAWIMRAKIQMGSIVNYHWQETSDDKKYRLSIVSGRTDVPAFRDSGFFEVAIMKQYPKRKLGDIEVIQTVCDFEEVWKIQKKFRNDPYKMWESMLKANSYSQRLS